MITILIHFDKFYLFRHNELIEKPIVFYTRCSIYAPCGIIDAVVILHRKEKPQDEVFTD